jgi:DNA mismatch repair ATPase MutS
LAGVNEEVLDNARGILQRLESSDIAFSDKTTSVATDESAVQIKKLLADVDINKCSPMEALQILHDLTQMAKG